MRIFVAVTTLLLLCAPAIAQKAPPAATPPGKSLTLPPKMVPMQVLLVRSAQAECEPSCPEWIAAQGDIDSSSVESFKKVLKAIGTRKVPILIDSNGGTVDAAFTIGRMIRAKGLDVAVTKTAFKPCADTDKACLKGTTPVTTPRPGLPREYLSKCASSCAFILAAGTRRYVGPRTFVGVHQITTFQTQARVLRKYKVWTKRVWGVPVETRKELVSEQKLSETVVQMPTKDSTYTKIRKYFAEMGIDERIVTLLMETPATTLHVLSRAELVETRIATDMIDGQELITGVQTLKPSVAAALGAPSGAELKSPDQPSGPTTRQASSMPAVPAPPPAPGAATAPAVKIAAPAPASTTGESTGSAATSEPPTGPPQANEMPDGEQITETVPAIAQPAKPAAAEKTVKPRAQPPAAEPKARTQTATASPGNPKCACPQMQTCSGTWVRMTCSGLKALCRNADTLSYTKNGCGRLKQLVGGF